jgi:Ankyrin repeats (many copies)
VICRDAAYFGKLGLLQWLHSNGCQWNENIVLLNACRCGKVPMLQWLVSVTKPWSQSTKAAMLDIAASCDGLAAAQWLRACGAAWPVTFASEYDSANGEVVNQCWSLSAVQRAIANGSGWLKWKCADYHADQYHADDKKQATDVLSWVHANGCPCTCSQQQQQQ